MKQPYNTTIYNTALYLRLSRDDELQGESGSIQTQRMMLRQYAAEHGLTVVDEYIDDGWSGTNFERPSFQRMIDDIEDGKINCVVTKDLSRLGRNYILTGQYTEIYFPSTAKRRSPVTGGRRFLLPGRPFLACAFRMAVYNKRELNCRKGAYRERTTSCRTALPDL